MKITERYRHGGMEGTDASLPWDAGERSRGHRLLTGALVVALFTLPAGLFAPSVRAQGPGPVQGWVSALEQTPKQARTDSAGFTLDRTEHDFGRVALGDTVSTAFRVTAQGGPVVLLSATTDCGCTRAEFAKRPLRDGESAQVKVIFAASKDRGNFRKTVRLRLHAGGRERIVELIVKGTVE